MYDSVPHWRVRWITKAAEISSCVARKQKPGTWPALDGAPDVAGLLHLDLEQTSHKRE